MWIAFLIAIPILFVIGTVVSALKEQRRLEHGLLQKIIKERQEKKAEHLKMLEEYKKSLNKKQ